MVKDINIPEDLVDAKKKRTYHWFQEWHMQCKRKHDGKTLLPVTRHRSEINRIGGCGLDSFGL